MLKVKEGTVHIEGTRIDLITEFMCLANTLLRKGVIDKDSMLFLMGTACIPEKELKRMLIDEIDQMDDIGEAWKLLNKLG